MRKLILTALAVASLTSGGAVLAQGSGYDAAHPPEQKPPQNPANITPYGPVPGTPEYRGNSGWTPDQAYGNNPNPQGYRGRYPPAAAVPALPLPREVQRQRERERLAAERREREREINANRRVRDTDWTRDRDGDGINNRRDRYPDDPTRW